MIHMGTLLACTDKTRKTTIVLILILLSGFLTAQTAEPEPVQGSYSIDLSDMPGDLLIAQARNARKAGDFSSAIRMLQTALQSPYGERQFMEGMRETIKKVNIEMESEAARLLAKYAGKSRDLLEVTVKEVENSKKNENLARKFQIETRILLKDKISLSLSNSIFRKSSEYLEKELRQQFPKNPLVFYSHQSRFYFEGYCNSEYPEIVPIAHYELGLLYKDYQDFKMAEIHYDLALRNKDFFSSVEMEYAVKYELAKIYLYAGKQNLFEGILKEIVGSQDIESITGINSAIFFTKIKKTLLDSPAGIDKVIQLYRIPDDFSREAHYLLGRYYLERHDYENAMHHLVLAVLQVSSTITAEIRKAKPEFQFESMQKLLELAGSMPEYSNYLTSSLIYESMYALAFTLFQQQANKSAAGHNIMLTLAALPQAGEFSLKARRYLE